MSRRADLNWRALFGDHPTVISTKELARLLKIKPSRVRQWAYRDGLKAWYPGRPGCSSWFSTFDVLCWMVEKGWCTHGPHVRTSEQDPKS